MCHNTAVLPALPAPPPRSLIHTGSRLQFCPPNVAVTPQLPPLQLGAVKDGGGYRAAWSPAGTTGSGSRKWRFSLSPALESLRPGYSTVARGCTCCLVLENHFCVEPDIRTSICKDGNTERDRKSGWLQGRSGRARYTECCRKAATAADLIQVATLLTTTNGSASLVRKQSNTTSLADKSI